MTDTHIYQQARLARDIRFDGQFFVAVKSTGIFCRPICPAPAPKEENVEYYDMAPLAMQAGYRPCLRCRPDSAPGSYAWKGVDTTVERGVKLLRAHPELSIAQICEKLGVSDRYLRDLFNRKLGIAPKKLRLFDQLLFAKHLLHQTHLSIENVALASGFSSARRLQENLKTGLQLSPSRIRKTGSQTSAHQTAEDSEHMNIQMAFRAPYNWPHLRDFLARRAIPEIEEIGENYYAKYFTLGAVKGRFTATFNQQKRCFDVALETNDLAQIQRVVHQIRRVLDLDLDPELVTTGLLKSGLPEQCVVSGIRIPGVWSSFEAGCRAILGQQISVKAAVNLVSEFAKMLGEHSRDHLFFPTPERVARADLSFLKIPQKRKETLQQFAIHCMAQEAEDDLTSWLSIKGIGPWTLAYAQMRGQSQPDIWLNTDLIIKQQLQKHQLEAQLVAPWRSYLTFQLWSMA